MVIKSNAADQGETIQDFLATRETGGDSLTNTNSSSMTHVHHHLTTTSRSQGALCCQPLLCPPHSRTQSLTSQCIPSPPPLSSYNRPNAHNTTPTPTPSPPPPPQPAHTGAPYTSTSPPPSPSRPPHTTTQDNSPQLTHVQPQPSTSTHTSQSQPSTSTHTPSIVGTPKPPDRYATDIHPSPPTPPIDQPPIIHVVPATHPRLVSPHGRPRTPTCPVTPPPPQILPRENEPDMVPVEFTTRAGRTIKRPHKYISMLGNTDMHLLYNQPHTSCTYY
ncbi:hypothetical protein Pcinc_001757 [Petrolisthes cinctipes]|uniref:Uncharacterized protein n=1 Tax=Petrolisthes cinctipes TaxID=88211 RepID=A0AAE1L491_PETCI|nr:hypothetical protein Pcinc_001757 [Petrolisthes cinctipes]